MDDIVDDADEVNKMELRQDIGLVFVVACDEIDLIHCRHGANNNQFFDLIALSPILPHKRL